jgi:hypothetical protein
MVLFCVVLGFGAKQERNSMGPCPKCCPIRLVKKIHPFVDFSIQPRRNMRQALGAMSKTLALDFGCVLRTTNAFVALGFFPAVLLLSKCWQGGANLFAPSREVGRELDAARALPIPAF